MAITQTLVVFDWSDLSGGPPTGSDRLQLSEAISDGISVLRPNAETVTGSLNALGQSALIVPANDDGTTTPVNTFYKHIGHISTSVVREIKQVSVGGQATVISGSGAPSGGANGNWYVQTSTGTAFGPKAAGVWPTTGIVIGNWDNDVPDGQVYWAALPLFFPSSFDGGGGGGNEFGAGADVSNTGMLRGTSNVESLFRANDPSQLTPLRAPLNLNNQPLVNFSNGGMQLAAAYYAPGTPATPTRASTTMAAIDTTNLTVGPFVAPSIAVIVELTAMVNLFSGSGNIVFCLFTHGTTTQVGVHATALQAGGATPVLPVTVKILVAPLTIGNSYQFDWAWGVTGGATAIMQMAGIASGVAGSGDGGPASMRVLVP